MSIAAAWRFETAMGAGETGVEFIAISGDEAFIRSPTAGGEALVGRYDVKRVAGGTEVLLAAIAEICLHGGTESIAETVGVMISKGVLAFGKRIEIGLIEQKAARHGAVAIASAAFVG